MNNINLEDIIDTKVVNNTTYSLVLCKENDTKMKLWIPDYIIKQNMDKKELNSKNENPMKKKKSSENPKPHILSIDEKISQIYHKLSRSSEEESSRIRSQLIQLHLHALPKSMKSEIDIMIRKIMENYRMQHKINQSSIKKLRENILLEEFVSKRRTQLSMLFCLEKEINLISKTSKKIKIINFVDLEILPFSFAYINTNIAGRGIVFPKNPPIGCDCIGKNICLLNNCCPEMFNNQPNYNEQGEVMVPPHMPIYECNKNCKCMKLCSNRVVQRGNNIKLTIFRTKNKGWGVQAGELIKKGKFVLEYVGKIITREQSNQLRQEGEKNHYLFDLNFNAKNDDKLYTIDSSEHGNISRFINHSSDPNLEVYAVWINSSTPTIYHVGLFAGRNIQVGEELTFHYGHICRNSDPLLNDCKCILCSSTVKV